MSFQAAGSAFSTTWSNPAGVAARGAFAARGDLYAQRWARYQNDQFLDGRLWSKYRTDRGLYRHIRDLYNPTKRLCQFYAGIIYPGALSADGQPLDNGVPLAIPLADDLDPALREAIAQLWQWWNWSVGKSLLPLYGAALGEVGVELVDDLDRRKIHADILWPGDVADLDLDVMGNAKSYALEYGAEDEDGKAYTYRREVDGETIRTFKDGSAHEYDGLPSVRPNPYGFAPLVWIKHNDEGGTHGAPALRCPNKIDELNELSAHAHDRTHDALNTPIVVSGRNVAGLDTAPVGSSTRSLLPAAPLPNTSKSRSAVPILKAEEGGQVSTVQLPEGQVLHYMQQLIGEIEADHPELTMYQQLRDMSQVTGPAAEILQGDTVSLVQRARANYDSGLVKLLQMGVAMAGFRANGDWRLGGATLGRQREKFTAFGLDSYNAGDLDFEILSRPVIGSGPLTVEDKRLVMDAVERGFTELAGQDLSDVATLAEPSAARVAGNDAAGAGEVDVERILLGGFNN